MKFPILLTSHVFLMSCLLSARFLPPIGVGLPTPPLGLDLYMPVPESNPITREKVDLGRRLFSDKRLSHDGSISCTSCHDSARAFSTNRAVPVGVFGRTGRRNAPAVINRGYGRTFFWDGRSSSLEEQVLKPIEDSNEMDLPVAEAAARVKLNPTVLAQALASYVRSIRSGDSRFDRFTAGHTDALSDVEKRGLQIFRGKGNCTACHAGPNFTDEKFHNTGVAFRDGAFSDDGRQAVSKLDKDRGAFKTPTLREVSRTAPYMHDGSLGTLEDVVEFYSNAGRVNPYLDPEIRPRNFTADEKRALIAFLYTLNGRLSEGWQ
jgi:cytochrome c peroxidase